MLLILFLSPLKQSWSAKRLETLETRGFKYDSIGLSDNIM